MNDITRRSFVHGILGVLAGARVIEAKTIDSAMSKKNDIVLEDKLYNSPSLSNSEIAKKQASKKLLENRGSCFMIFWNIQK